MNAERLDIVDEYRIAELREEKAVEEEPVAGIPNLGRRWA